MVRVTYIGQVPGPGGAAGDWTPGETRTVKASDSVRLLLGWPGSFRLEEDDAVMGANRLPPLRVR